MFLRQVPPAELEALLLTHPAVLDSAVVARADDAAGEVPVAFVVVKPDATEVGIYNKFILRDERRNHL